jgi:hypothetical protein
MFDDVVTPPPAVLRICVGVLRDVTVPAAITNLGPTDLQSAKRGALRYRYMTVEVLQGLLGGWRDRECAGPAGVDLAGDGYGDCPWCVQRVPVARHLRTSHRR